LSEPERGEQEEDGEDDEDPLELGEDVREARALEGDTSYDAVEVRQGERLREPLRRARHPFEGEHEAREQDVRQEEEEGELHRLLLRRDERREEEPYREASGDERDRDRVEHRQRAHERHVEDVAT